MNLPFHSRPAPKVEAARSVPLPTIAPQSSIAAKLATGELYRITPEEARDLPYYLGPVIPDYSLGADYMLCRHTLFGQAFRVYLDTLLCGSCDSVCPDGICSECGE